MTTTKKMCVASACTNRALENGYCEIHQDYSDGSPIEIEVNTETQFTWRGVLIFFAVIFIFGGLIYGLNDLSELNDKYIRDYVSTTVKVKAILVPVFITSSVALILITLGKIISLLDSKKE